MHEKIAKFKSYWAILILGMAFANPVLSAAKSDKGADAAAGSPAMKMTLEEKGKAVQQILQGKLSKAGADTCISCHDEDNEYPVFPLFKTKHAVKADPRSPMAHEQQCESCHGPGNDHVKAKKPDKRAGNIINYGKSAWTPIQDQNQRCLNCHQTHKRIDWKGSSHEFNDMACASCHKLHVAKDPILDRRQQSKVCYGCHLDKQSKFYQASHHPVREGQMACSDCHNVHGGDGGGLLIKTVLRDKCVSCHAEKRGPFLWEHAPAAEDCGLCHEAHGSNHAALLKKRPPQLCQQCHAISGHPSVSYNGSRLANSVFLQVKGCVNCHSQMHGSNHPSGRTPVR